MDLIIKYNSLDSNIQDKLVDEFLMICHLRDEVGINRTVNEHVKWVSKSSGLSYESFKGQDGLMRLLLDEIYSR